ncbi:ADP-ribosylglycohydrolase family protein [Streptomyces sp. DW26H14]|uniref:ADP-ribosylglycohydrolase family protein n=1 Tax=Streptomyces sp. DW26H14 TaxID=3435395 RepID=UPI00403DBA1F
MTSYLVHNAPPARPCTLPLADRVAGALTGAAAAGGPGAAEAIRLTHALVGAYEEVRDHLDAYAVAERLGTADGWLRTRLRRAHADPREAGAGNCVDAGAAVYAAPVGLVNAANPASAYTEALDVAAPHQSSYGREAAAVFAAAVAAACAEGATPASVVLACLAPAKDGTRAAIEAAADVASRHRDAESAVRGLRAAVAPYDLVGPVHHAPALGAGRPSRLHAVEELPVALGMLLIGAADYRRTVLGARTYGRGADTLALLTGTLAGALAGGRAVPRDWAKRAAEAAGVDLGAAAPGLTRVAAEVFARDTARRRAHERAFRAVAPAET